MSFLFHYILYHLHKNLKSIYFQAFGWAGIFICHYKVLDGVLKNPSSCQSYVLEKGCVDRLAHQEVSLSLSYWKKCNNWNQWKLKELCRKAFCIPGKKPQEFKTNESILSIPIKATDHQRWKMPFPSSFIKIFWDDGF